MSVVFCGNIPPTYEERDVAADLAAYGLRPYRIALTKRLPTQALRWFFSHRITYALCAHTALRSHYFFSPIASHMRCLLTPLCDHTTFLRPHR